MWTTFAHREGSRCSGRTASSDVGNINRKAITVSGSASGGRSHTSHARFWSQPNSFMLFETASVVKPIRQRPEVWRLTLASLKLSRHATYTSPALVVQTRHVFEDNPFGGPTAKRIGPALSGSSPACVRTAFGIMDGSLILTTDGVCTQNNNRKSSIIPIPVLTFPLPAPPKSGSAGRISGEGV